MDTFFSIWRNLFIKRLIRNFVCQDIVIKVTDGQYDDKEYKYLAMFSSQEKLDYNISIKYRDTMENYTNSLYRDIINSLYIELDTHDFSHIQEGVHSLYFTADLEKKGCGRLPQSLTYLNMCTYNEKSEVDVVQYVLSNLPSNLKTLAMPYNNIIARDVLLPDTLTTLSYNSTDNNLQHFVVSAKDRVLDKCVLQVSSKEALAWLHENKWINKISLEEVQDIEFDSNTIPPHVSSIDINDMIGLDESVFPPMLQSLMCYYPIPFYHLSHLKTLDISSYPVFLEPNVLPKSLENLSIDYNLPLEPGVLPIHLKNLYLRRFNQPLCVGSLPDSITILNLGLFNQPLLPYVLPLKLKELSMFNFTQPMLSKNTLPLSLTHIFINAFKGSFEASCQPLDNLQLLMIGKLDHALSTILCSVKSIKIWVDVIDSSSDLSNTCMQNLYLSCWGESNRYSKPFPRTIKQLTLNNVAIQSFGIIPDGCLYLKSSGQHINTLFIPKSVKSIIQKK
ncbi:hypothetical protein CYY_003184 [Polysphondylium violaceum]|uniref:FNIP repeat-containing protein n=1 Tax=Polysphondylium violaceum TaxID=133409 RepID=A0A8J4PV75_9MYCE|nr:hypothetical protein CYY_003184 [Polysphondylium violaceum]